MRRLVIAGASSGAGKTTVAVGLMAALTQRGLKVQGFKTGPDYIDPGFHTAATGRISRNLDTWMLPPDAVREVFLRGACGADIAIIEGVMGLYDGVGSGSGPGSTAYLAKLLCAPVVLVLDVRGMAASAAAVVLGFREFDPELGLAGVILTCAGSARHAALVKEAIEAKAGVPVLGYLVRDPELELPARHLGLVPAEETVALQERIGKLAAVVAGGVDLEAVLRVAAAPPVPRPPKTLFPEVPAPPQVRLAVARDAAFSFYYPENLELLAAAGAELAFFSPLRDEKLPPGSAGLYLGGGFPEVFAGELAANTALQEEIRRAVAAGMPTVAECGGLLYLCAALTAGEATYPLVGVLPGRVALTERLQRLGYVEAEALAPSPLLDRGEKVRGHVFHYSRINWEKALPPAYRLVNWRGEAQVDGAVYQNLVASYLHPHFLSRLAMARRFVACCAAFRASCRRVAPNFAWREGCES
ncbi:cobyrinate a,c-diamide synthase [Thermodesulfitimonas sp.]